MEYNSFVGIQSDYPAGSAAELVRSETVAQNAAKVNNKMNNDAEIRELIARFAKAFRAKDVDGIMSFFAPEIVSFDILPPLEAVGTQVFVTHWQEFFGSYESLDIEFADIRIAAADDLAFSYCLHRVKGMLKNGQQTDWWLRWTACYRKTDGKWLIVHEQVSVPVDLKNGKAMLDLRTEHRSLAAQSSSRQSFALGM